MLPSYVGNSLAVATLIEAGGAEYLLTALHTGQTYRDIAAGLGITRRSITTWLVSQSDDVIAELTAANTAGIAAMMEDTVAIADDIAGEIRAMEIPVIDRATGLVVDHIPVEPSVLLAAEKTRIAVRQHYAERKDKENWGPRPTTEITITQNTLHLDALRRCYDPAYERPVAVVPEHSTVASLGSPTVLDSTQPAIPASPSPHSDLW